MTCLEQVTGRMEWLGGGFHKDDTGPSKMRFTGSSKFNWSPSGTIGELYGYDKMTSVQLLF